jgi:hypothetical protein
LKNFSSISFRCGFSKPLPLERIKTAKTKVLVLCKVTNFQFFEKIFQNSIIFALSKPLPIEGIKTTESKRLFLCKTTKFQFFEKSFRKSRFFGPSKCLPSEGIKNKTCISIQCRSTDL